ncbi:hypothetical protein ASPZODRAFT_788632 [Penicilliopsis zonata CBS 506.65]|uniref:Membrane anchor Opy2 N-terminal domain-containing protein n=1 Tax=Penicilliopsis zonata CBS 506.65 TaxID=1073090 RepID=A0A1L9SB73_9EURO|nr:hypothetical protein ASPZODRAFT_788632 [Penicilliopsis zonata CBS 506.65]OJJ44423.1 hypothetical protein ASPZODRAFT_788632 [Penicilliopsis zonata CBS 506.65]
MSLHFSDSFSPIDFSARSVFKRCVSCSSSAPACPTCADGYTCTMTSESCTACATTSCVKDPTTTTAASTPAKSTGGGTNAGAIAGGVIGGLALVAIVTFLVWWFVIRKKRQQEETIAREDTSMRSVHEKVDCQSNLSNAQQARKSTNSIASTVLTRASNVIQIAYIPGVTNRSPSDTPDHLVPPVPPLPGAAPDQHFFMPGDLRDSAWSGLSGHQSISPSLRSSVATTIYRNNAIVSPMPAQQIMRSRAAVVSIHNTSADDDDDAAATSLSGVPAVPAISPTQIAHAQAISSPSMNNSSIVARTVTAKPVTVTRSGKPKPSAPTAGATPVLTITEEQPESRPTTADGATSSPSSSSSSSSPTHNQTDTATTVTVTISHDNANAEQSPFKDQPEEQEEAVSAKERHRRTMSSTGLVADLPIRGESPFSDANEVK